MTVQITKEPSGFNLDGLKIKILSGSMNKVKEHSATLRFGQMGIFHQTQKQQSALNTKMIERYGPETAEQQRCEIHIIRVIVHCDKQSLSTSCLAADIVPGLLVFSLQTNCFRVRLESGQDLLLLEDLGSVDLFHIRAQLLRSIMSKQTETRPKKRP